MAELRKWIELIEYVAAFVLDWDIAILGVKLAKVPGGVGGPVGITSNDCMTAVTVCINQRCHLWLPHQ